MKFSRHWRRGHEVGIRTAVPLASALLVLAGCSGQPPGCSDARTIQALQDALGEQSRASHGLMPDLVKKHFVGQKLVVDAITTDGYDADAKRHLCQADVQVPGSRLSHSVQYVVQTIEGDANHFVVRTSPVTYVLSTEMLGHAISLAQQPTQHEASKAVTYAENPVPRWSLPSSTEASVASPEPVANTLPTKAAPDPALAEGATTSANSAKSEVAASPVVKPSFKCEGSLSKAEVFVCSNPVLAEADSNLAAAYKQAIAGASAPETLKQEQRAWLKKRENCSDVECLQAMYATRTQELSR